MSENGTWSNNFDYNSNNDNFGTGSSSDPADVNSGYVPVAGDNDVPLIDLDTAPEWHGLNTNISSESGGTIESPSPSVRVSFRESKMPKKFDNYILHGKYKYVIERVVNCSYLDSDSLCFVSNLNKTIEPKHYSEACNDQNWISAMNDEMEALYRNQTWVLTDLPPGRKPVGCKWVYKIKYKSNGEIDRYKARLVAKGYSKKEGVDFSETFSPVAKLVTFRCVIHLAVNNNWKLCQLDVNNAFLYGTIDEEVYMSLPPRYFNKNEKKSL